MSVKVTAEGHELYGVEAVLFVPDVAATLAFYRDVLGFNVDFASGSPPVHARVSSGDPASPATARIRFELTAAPLAAARSCYLYVYVGRALDDLFAAYRDRGVEIVGGPKDRPWGLRQFEVRDCNGYSLTFSAEIAGAGQGGAAADGSVAGAKGAVLDAKICQATMGDLPAMLRLVRECVDQMRARGIDQWDDVYPDRATIEGDVEEQTAYVATVEAVVIGMAVLNERQEPEYGAVPWLFGGRPAVVHRLMVAPRVEGRGIAGALMTHLEAQARSRGFDCIRLDTFTGNARAVRFYERGDYRRAGQVRLRKGEFHCFEKQLRMPV